MLPVLIFVAIQAFVIFSDERRSVQNTSAERARQIIERVDNELDSNIRALKAFAQLIPDPAAVRPQPNSPQRSRFMSDIFPDWAGSIIWRIGEANARSNTMRADPEIPIADETWSDLVESAGPTVIDGIRRLGEEYVALLHAPLTNRGSEGYVLTLAMRPQVFQAILLSELPEGSVGAIVDREGRFIARSIDYEQRLGQPGSLDLRNSLRSGELDGVYRGTTLEGLANYTAYHTSSVSGWSAHIAIATSLVDTPRSWSLGIAIVGGLICLALSGGLLFLVAQDNTERRRQDDMLMQAQKMESLGQLTGGIAHDFNNLLTVIIGNLEKLKRGIGEANPDMRGAAETALNSSRRAAGLTQGLLAYARRQSLLPRVIDVNELARGMAEIMSRTLGQNITVRTELAADVWLTEVDENQLGSALLNLAVNARDAMPNGGTITISTRNQNFARDARDLSLKPGDYVVMSVTDTGQGMPADVVDKAFEPFFTTKGVGQGTGLGLSQVFGFLQQSGGTAVIDSRPGQGTTIHLYLPRSFSTATAAAGEAAEKVAAAAVKALRILFVEDDEGVRKHGLELLGELGHKVVEAYDVRAALDALATKGPFDLIVTDIVLPGGKSGLDLAREIRRTKPDAKILFVTGYAGPGFEEASKPGNVTLAKPYAREDLERKIAEAMSQTPSQETGRGAVLLVEDEVLIRMLSVDVLGEAGLETLEAGSGAEALKHLKADPWRIGLAVVDLGLPDMPGEKLVEAMRAIRPDLPVLIASGHSGPRRGDSADPVLPKPYEPSALLAAVQKLLAGRG